MQDGTRAFKCTEHGANNSVPSAPVPNRVEAWRAFVAYEAAQSRLPPDGWHDHVTPALRRINLGVYPMCKRRFEYSEPPAPSPLPSNDAVDPVLISLVGFAVAMVVVAVTLAIMLA